MDNVATTKYLNFAKLLTGFVVSPGSSTVTQIRFSTANDAPERDPLTFSIYGSNSLIVTGSEAVGSTFDSASFTPIALNQTITGFVVDPNRSTQVAAQPIANVTPYSTYMVIFPTVRNSATANSMQVGDVLLLNAASATVTTSTSPIVGGLQLVPEPGTLGLATVGLVGFLARRRRVNA